MAGGFGTVPDDLFRAASAITDAVSGANGMPWNDPSGDYGHAGVQDGWTRFVSDLKSAVDTMVRTAEGHSDNLRTSAANYAETDDASKEAIGTVLGGMPGERTEGSRLPNVPGGGFTGNLTPDELNQRLGKPGGVS